ncbi:hypothetical protein ACHAXS_008283, partial [Conticribra weissflogii]
RTLFDYIIRIWNTVLLTSLSYRFVREIEDLGARCQKSLGSHTNSYISCCDPAIWYCPIERQLEPTIRGIF